MSLSSNFSKEWTWQLHLTVKKGAIGERGKEIELGGTAKSTPFTLATKVSHAFSAPKVFERREKDSHFKKWAPSQFNHISHCSLNY